MTLIELLQQTFNATDEQITAFSNAMKENKIFTSSEENMDIRYGKMKDEHETLKKQYGEATTLIETLKKSSKGQEEAQQKIAAFEQQVGQLQDELAKTKLESAIRVELLAAKAVTDDVDYLTFRLKEKGEELALDGQGKIKGWEDKLAGLKAQFPKHFEAEGKRHYIENKLPTQSGNSELNPKNLAEALQMEFENKD